jgi:DNA-binding transcriptional regulator YiaG
MNLDLTAPMSAEEVRAAREALGFATQEALADALGLEAKFRRDTIRSWESGRQPIPGPPRLAIRLMLKFVESGNGRQIGIVPREETACASK